MALISHGQNSMLNSIEHDRVQNEQILFYE